MSCHRCGYVTCECSACQVCDTWVWSERLTINPDGDWSCPTCLAAGRRHPDHIQAEAEEAPTMLTNLTQFEEILDDLVLNDDEDAVREALATMSESHLIALHSKLYLLGNMVSGTVKDQFAPPAHAELVEG